MKKRIFILLLGVLVLCGCNGSETRQNVEIETEVQEEILIEEKAEKLEEVVESEQNLPKEEVVEESNVVEKIVIEDGDYEYILQWLVPNERDTYENIFGFNMPFDNYQEQGYEGFVAEDGTDIFSAYEFFDIYTGESFKVGIEDDKSIGILKKFQETGNYEEGDVLFYSYEVKSIEKKDSIETSYGSGEIFLVKTPITIYDGSEITLVWEVTILEVNGMDIVIAYQYPSQNEANYSGKLLEMIPQMF